jgi:rSAM/selenodomain-associated transferase 1
LIIFTRYPEPGKTKTRMIATLGEEGAAMLQRQMTENTLTQAQKLQRDRKLSVEVYFAGGNELLMQDWLGSDLVYRQQCEGDLGQRMVSAFKQTFAMRATRVVMIGIDCPDLNEMILAEAFERLSEHDLVLGPAVDGGYYLIGLNRLISELFTGISWGTSTVLATTQKIANQLGLNAYYLPRLHDIDRPEDLPIWQRYQIEP